MVVGHVVAVGRRHDPVGVQFVVLVLSRVMRSRSDARLRLVSGVAAQFTARRSVQGPL